MTSSIPPRAPSTGPPHNRPRRHATSFRRRAAAAAASTAVLAAAFALLVSGLPPGWRGPPDELQIQPVAPCTVSSILVPSCGAWWGVAAGAFTDTPPAPALRRFERLMGRQATIFHTYHRGDELFPTATEIAAAREYGKNRLLLINWKVAAGTTWAAVAAGRQDARIDRLAAHVKKTFPERFFLAIHHEPENDVRPAAGSGMTAADYAAMYRHTVKRLRAKGVTNVVTVMAYMGYWNWGVQPWFGKLYPGDDVVDWIGFDPYNSANPASDAYGDFASLVNRTGQPAKFPGFYSWATRKHPRKPLMLSEWGVFEHRADLSRKPWIFSTVATQFAKFPAIKGFVYFDTPRAPKGDTRIDSSPQALAAYRKLAANPAFRAKLPASG